MLRSAVRVNKRDLTRQSTWSYVRAHPWLYILMLPGLAYVIIFHYLPMYGVVIAFQNFNLIKGVFGSPWIGLQNFRELFGSSQFFKVFKNSLVFSLIRMFWGFPAPILLALLLNEVRRTRFKRTVQTIVYIPHFISWTVIAGMLTNLLAPTADGAVNTLLGWLGIGPVTFLTNARMFRSVIVTAEIWKSAGWGTIIYLSALTRVDPELYEAAVIDGANRWQMCWRITLPSIMSTVAVMMILRLGSLLNNGFEQIFLLYSPLVYEVADVFETYTYRLGLQGGRFSYSTAVGLFQSLVGFVMIVSTNYISRRISDSGLY